jgi:hypothetical protein
LFTPTSPFLPQSSEGTEVEHTDSATGSDDITPQVHNLTQPLGSIRAKEPILANVKCSGYFLEPVSSFALAYCSETISLIVWPDLSKMAWMEPFLQNGQLSGKIVCPNKRCGAKLGNYDWAGVHCACKQWVVPVSRSYLLWRPLLPTICPIGSLFLLLFLLLSFVRFICCNQG